MPTMSTAFVTAPHVYALLAGVALAAVATWAFCRWWYGRKLTAAAQRLRKSDEGRLFVQQQAQQARKQIETLKAELDTLRASASKSREHVQRTRELEEALRAAERRAAFQLSGPAPLDTEPGGHHGFADTQILN